MEAMPFFDEPDDAFDRTDGVATRAPSAEDVLSFLVSPTPAARTRAHLGRLALVRLCRAEAVVERDRRRVA